MAELDLQEVATALLSADGRSPLPLLVSEYGAGFKSASSPQYSPGHDWWILRAVTAKFMEFLNRPDRILKALPFIVGKATWNTAGRENNASHSYPWVMWRSVTPAIIGDEQIEKESDSVYIQTHLHKWYAALQNVDGDRFVARSDTANVQVHGFRSSNGSYTEVSLVLNNLAFQAGSNMTVLLDWPKSILQGLTLIETRRLYWDETTAIPQLDILTGGDAAPAKLELRPAELVVMQLQLSTDIPKTITNEFTIYPDRFLQSMANSEAAARPYMFSLLNRSRMDGLAMRVRIGFGGGANSSEGSLASFTRTATGLGVTINGVPCEIDIETQIAGPLHINHKDFTFFSS